MENKTDYRLANIQKKEAALAQQRNEILNMDSEQSLDSILGAKSPATLIQSFPDQDLYYLMHKIGVRDFIPVLAMATSEQWEYILDIEVWNDDRIDIENTSKVLDILFQADPKRLMRWVIKEKPDFIEYFYFKNVEVIIREHDEVTPDDDDFMTFDDKFYFRFPNRIKNDDIIPELIEKMFRTVADMDISVFHGLMLETLAVMPAETEEEQFRLKNIRLAEKGFSPFHDAIGIYQPVKLDAIKKRSARKLNSRFDPDLPLPPQYHTQFIKGENLFVKSFEMLNSDLVHEIQAELASLINKLISADRIKLREKEDIEKAINRVCSYLSLGVEKILEQEKTISVENAVNVLKQYFLEDIFRTGSAQSIKLKSKALNFYQNSFIKKNNLPIAFLDEHWLGIIGGLFLERPLLYDNYKTKDLYKEFESIEEINYVMDELEKIIEVDTVLSVFDIDFTHFNEGILTYKSLFLTLWAKSRIGLELSLEPIPVDIFRDFFKALFKGEAKGKIDQMKRDDFLLWLTDLTAAKDLNISTPFIQAANDLFEELENEYGGVKAAEIDPKFILHFLLAS